MNHLTDNTIELYQHEIPLLSATTYTPQKIPHILNTTHNHTPPQCPNPAPNTL
jgi:hypothetical protein